MIQACSVRQHSICVKTQGIVTRHQCSHFPVKTLLMLLFCSLKYIIQSSVLVFALDPNPERQGCSSVSSRYIEHPLRHACLKLLDPSLLFLRRAECCQRSVFLDLAGMAKNSMHLSFL